MEEENDLATPHTPSSATPHPPAHTPSHLHTHTHMSALPSPLLSPHTHPLSPTHTLSQLHTLSLSLSHPPLSLPLSHPSPSPLFSSLSPSPFICSFFCCFFSFSFSYLLHLRLASFSSSALPHFLLFSLAALLIRPPILLLGQHCPSAPRPLRSRSGLRQRPRWPFCSHDRFILYTGPFPALGLGPLLLPMLSRHRLHPCFGHSFFIIITFNFFPSSHQGFPPPAPSTCLRPFASPCWALLFQRPLAVL